ncbi:transglutaminase-like cysteine peptidase [Sphingomonas sp. KR3-1]|uniref:transglutaminase-like cysteine peptidase n=1 Tax=Sphingomonas sp. KR3-1 TaxID=3156611 RepID=UPI0032B5888F
MSSAAAEAPESRERGEVALRLADAPRWTDVLAREARDAAPLARPSIRCMMPADDLPAACGARDWRAAFQGLRGLSQVEQVAGVQAAVNGLPYVSDMANWGMADRWETPAEMFARGGDCEDFALTKYFALRDLGMPESAMRIAIVWDTTDQEQHAVLFVDAGGQSWVLDNKFPAPVAAASVAARYRVIWSVNRDGARLSTADGEEDAGPRLRVARGGRMLVLRTRPLRRDAAEPLPRIELASAGQGRAGPPAGFAQLGARLVPAGLAQVALAAIPLETLPLPRPPALRDQLARVGALALRDAGK